MSIEALSRKLAIAGVKHIVVAGDDKIKVTTKLVFPKADMLIIDEREGKEHRGRIVLEGPTKVKICNAYSRTLGRVKTYGHFPWRLNHDTYFQFRTFSKAEGPKVETVKVQFVDKTSRKPVYSMEDITSGEVEIIEAK